MTSRVLRSPLAAALVAGVAVAWVVGGVAGVVLGALSVCAFAIWLRRLEPLQQRRRRERISRDLPIAAEILAACTLAGASVEDALRATALAIDGPLGELFTHVAQQLEWGADPRSAWQWADTPETSALARVVVRCLDSGSSVSVGLLRVAGQLRAQRRSSARATARTVGVRAAAPLGLCFLPAFVLVGVVPVVVALAETLVDGQP